MVQEVAEPANYTSVVTWLIVIFGWLVVNHQQNQRETRKELRARLDLIEGMVNDTEQSAIRYHTSAHDPGSSRTLKSDIDRLSNLTRAIGNIISCSFSYRIVRFRQSVTLKNFDSSEHQILTIDHEVIDTIAKETQSLINELEEAYSYKYHMPFYKRFCGKISSK